MTTEHEDDLGGESSEEMAEPHVRYAPYAPIAGDQAIVSLHDFALSAQDRTETHVGNNPTIPLKPSTLGIRMKRLKGRPRFCG
jgi:hypothetical protein